MVTETPSATPTSWRRLVVFIGLCLAAIGARASNAQGLTTLITQTSTPLSWTGEMVLADHAAAYEGRLGSTNPIDSEIFAFVLGTKSLVRLTNDTIEDHSLVGSGNRLLWTAGRGSASVLREYLITRGTHRTITKPFSGTETRFLSAHSDVAVATDNATGCLWALDLGANSWQCLSTLFVEGTDPISVNGRDVAWVERNSGWAVKVWDGSTTRTIHTVSTQITELSLRRPYVVWSQPTGPGATKEVYAYDLNARTTTPITNNAFDDASPVLSRARLTWLAPTFTNGPIFVHYKDLDTNGPVQVLPITATSLKGAFDGVFYLSGRLSRTLYYLSYLESDQTFAIENAVYFGNTRYEANGRTAIYRMGPNDIQLNMPQLDARPADPVLASDEGPALYMADRPIFRFNNYVVGASLSGITPGFQIGLTRVPLNLDVLLYLSVTLRNQSPFSNTSGQLDGYGHALGFFAIVPPLRNALVGIDVYFAYYIFPADVASNPTRVRIRP